MEPFPLRTWASLLVDLFLLACCIVRVPDLDSRARAPFDVLQADDRVVVSGLVDRLAAPDLRPGDTLISYDGSPLLSYRDVEFISDFGTIGEKVPVSFTTRGQQLSTTVALVPYFNRLYTVIVIIIGLVAMAVATFVLVKRPRDRTGMILHWALMSFGACVIIAWEGRGEGSVLGYGNSLAFFGTYALLAATFLLFTTLFPRPRLAAFSTKTLAVTLPLVAVIVPMIAHHRAAMITRSLTEYEAYLSWFDAFHVVLIVYALAGILNFVYSYVTAEGQDERKKLKWMMVGLIIGPLPFLLFTILPMTVAPRYLVPESYTLIFLLAIPITFTISFVKYHVLDVDLVINRATVYGVVIGVLLVVYIIVVGIAARLVGMYTETASVAAAVAIAILFQPARTQVQRFVDKGFFRVRYNLGEARRKILSEINGSYNVRQLAGLVLDRIREIIPVEQLAFMANPEPGRQVTAIVQRGFPRMTLPVGKQGLPADTRLPVALPERMESGIVFHAGDPVLFQRLGIAIALPLPSEHSGVRGYVALGGKKSGARYTLEDIDLLQAVAVQASLALERLELQERFLAEQAEAHRLEELNRMKSDFVAYVSHELHTPLTSIRMFAELLEQRLRRGDRKGKDYLRVIGGESDRLSRMVDAILDSARIEEGIMTYSLHDADLRTMTDQALEVMHYLLDRHAFQVRYRRPNRPVMISADSDSVTDIIINLIGNSIKYSASRKYLSVTVQASGHWAACSVADHGVGIPPEATPHLFERYYRSPGVASTVHGTGLGLPLVKHVMEAHHGRVEVKSALGKGSTFTLLFPKIKRHPIPSTTA